MGERRGMGRVRSVVAAAAALAALATAAGCAEDTTVTVAVTVRGSTATPVTTAGGGVTAPVTTSGLPTTPSVPATTPTTGTGTTGTGTTGTTTGTTSTGTTPTVARPADFPTAAEQDLLERLEEDIPPRCTRSTEQNASTGVTASLFCDLRSSDGVLVYFESFPDRPTMLSVYSSLRTGQKIRSDTRRCDRPRVALPAEGPWNVGGSGRSRGRVMCFRNRTNFWFVWTQDDVRAMGWAYGPRLPRVRDFWIRRTTIRS
jgi:hypothetical protein